MPKGYRSDEEVLSEDSDDEGTVGTSVSKSLQGRRSLGRPVLGSIVQSSSGDDDDEENFDLGSGSEESGSEEESESDLDEESDEEPAPAKPTASIVRPTAAKALVIPRPISLSKPTVISSPSTSPSLSRPVVIVTTKQPTVVKPSGSKATVLVPRRTITTAITTKSVPTTEEVENALVQSSGESKDFFEARKTLALRMQALMKTGPTVDDLIRDSRFLAQKMQTGVSYDPEVEIRLAKWLNEAL